MNFNNELLHKDLITSDKQNKLNKAINEDINLVCNHYKQKLNKINLIYNKNTGFINNSKNQLENISNTLNKYKNNFKKLKDKTDVYIDTFTNSNNIECNLNEYDKVLGFDRSLVSKPMIFRNKFQTVESQPIQTINVPYTISMTDKNYKESLLFGDLNNLKDDSEQNFFYESVTFSESVSNIIVKGDDGLSFSLELDLKQITVINEVILFPFSKYPIILKGIKYFDTKTKEAKFLDIKNIYLDDSQSFSFEEIQTNKIVLDFKQIHYEKEFNIYNYELGFYCIKINRNIYNKSNQFLTAPIYLKDMPIDYYMLNIKDVGDIKYKIIEYRKIQENQYLLYYKDILNTNTDKVLNEDVLFHDINNNFICQTKHSYELDDDIILYENNVKLDSKSDYVCFDDNKIQIFKYNPKAIYKVSYNLKHGTTKRTLSNNLKIEYVRILGIAQNNNKPCEIDSYMLKIKYKGGDDIVQQAR